MDKGLILLYFHMHVHMHMTCKREKCKADDRLTKNLLCMKLIKTIFCNFFTQ